MHVDNSFGSILVYRVQVAGTTDDHSNDNPVCCCHMVLLKFYSFRQRRCQKSFSKMVETNTG